MKVRNDYSKWAILASFFFIFVFSIQLTINVQYKFCQWLDSNSRPLELESTALPTEAQPLPHNDSLQAKIKQIKRIFKRGLCPTIQRVNVREEEADTCYCEQFKNGLIKTAPIFMTDRMLSSVERECVY